MLSQSGAAGRPPHPTTPSPAVCALGAAATLILLSTLTGVYATEKAWLLCSTQATIRLSFDDAQDSASNWLILPPLSSCWYPPGFTYVFDTTSLHCHALDTSEPANRNRPVDTCAQMCDRAEECLSWSVQCGQTDSSVYDAMPTHYLCCQHGTSSASYRVPGPPACSWAGVRNTTAVISSDDDDDDSQSCGKIVIAPVGFIMVLTVPIQNTTTALQVYDGSSASAPLLGSISSSSLGAVNLRSLRSTSRYMFVVMNAGGDNDMSACNMADSFRARLGAERPYTEPQSTPEQSSGGPHTDGIKAESRWYMYAFITAHLILWSLVCAIVGTASCAVMFLWVADIRFAIEWTRRADGELYDGRNGRPRRGRMTLQTRHDLDARQARSAQRQRNVTMNPAAEVIAPAPRDSHTPRRQSVIDALQSGMFVQPSAFGADVTGSEDECIICLMEIEPEEIVVTLQCSHTYHAKCITRWAARTATCPTCRTKISIQDCALHENDVRPVPTVIPHRFCSHEFVHHIYIHSFFNTSFCLNRSTLTSTRYYTRQTPALAARLRPAGR